MERSDFSSIKLEGESIAIVTVGVDLAMNASVVQGIDFADDPARRAMRPYSTYASNDSSFATLR
jgi:hypothetical protein